MLSPTQVDHYKTEGYTVVGNFLSNEQIAATRSTGSNRSECPRRRT